MILRCDNCGPYTPEEAAGLVLGTLRPVQTGYLCPRCERDIRQGAKNLADAIDAMLSKELAERFASVEPTPEAKRIEQLGAILQRQQEIAAKDIP